VSLFSQPLGKGPIPSGVTLPLPTTPSKEGLSLAPLSERYSEEGRTWVIRSTEIALGLIPFLVPTTPLKGKEKE
jgi:hypothetical protein